MMKKVLFVGITDKEGKEPFDSSTKSGMIIEKIMKRLENCVCKKINYVSFPPKDSKGKLRYPTKEELEASYPIFLENVLQFSPDLIVVCGNMIFTELKKKSFYQDAILKIYHPSYIWVYRRNQLDQYIESVVMQIKKIIF